MRTTIVIILAMLALAGGFWFTRPAALGDAGGLWSLTDRTLPAAAAWRAHLMTGQASSPAASGNAGATAKPKPPAMVAVQPVELKTLEITIEAVGTVQPVASIVIKPRTDSQVVSAPVAEGAAVKAGDLLFKLDDVALKAQLTQADAQIAKDRALLEQNQRDLARNQDLLKQKFVAPQIVETAQTTANQTTAQIAVDEAQRNNIATQLSYTEIRASVSGRIGSIAAKPGAAVKSGDTLATLNQIDPIYIAFSVPQGRLGQLRAAMTAGSAVVRLRDDATAPAGVIAFVENAVDSSTGTLGVKASMPNKGERLWPGAFANVVVVTGKEENALVVPSSAVQIGQKGSFVFVAKDGKAVIQNVEIERVVGDGSVVKSGIAAGDQVIVQGQMAITNGATITVAPSADGPAKDSGAPGKTASQG